jgi:putative ABC transport system permease protein
VRAELDALGARLEQAQPALNVGYRPSAFELGDELVGGVKRSMWVLMAAVACLLAMACVNVANLLLARGAARRKEVALRTALGAGRGRIVVQLLSESILLALGGGALGLLVAAAAIRLVAHAGPASVPRLALAALDARVYVFTFGVSLGTGILFGLAPALQGAAGSLSATLKDTTRGGTAGRSARRVRSSLVVAELALAVVVLIGAGLLIRSFIRLRSVDAGFQPAGLLTVRVPLSGARYSTPERKVAFLQQALSRIATLPGVRSVGMVDGLPLTGLGFGGNFAVEGRPPLSTEQRLPALLRAVSPSYFGTMGIPLVTGRLLADSDTAQAPPVILISRTLARRFWPNGNPIGGHIVIDRVEGKVHEIVGVVGDVKADRVDGEAWSTIYRPFTQAPNGAITLAIRTTGPPLSLASAVTREVHRLDAAQPVADVRTMEDVVSLAISGARFQTVLLMCFASVAFLLASVGIYGVISYDVSQRTNEIGVRMALGAQASDVRRLILGQGARLAVYGITAGLLGAVVVTRWMGALLFGVPPADPGTYAAIAVLLAAVALGASYAPSRRAMKLDPVAALKHE